MARAQEALKANRLAGEALAFRWMGMAPQTKKHLRLPPTTRLDAYTAIQENHISSCRTEIRKTWTTTKSLLPGKWITLFDLQFVIPLMLVFITARSVGNRFNDGIYDTQIRVKKMPFLEQVCALCARIPLMMSEWKNVRLPLGSRSVLCSFFKARLVFKGNAI